MLDAVNELGNTSSEGIKKYLDSKAARITALKARKKHENFEITSSQVQDYIDKNNKPIDIRTIQRCLKDLTEQGLIDTKNNQYSLSRKARFNIKYFAWRFGGLALNCLMETHHPTLFPFKDNLEKLIEMMGVYVVYCFIEAARPIEDSDNDNDNYSSSYMTNLDRDELALSWIEKVFSPTNMYEYFLAAVEHQTKDELVESNQQKHLKQNEDGDWVFGRDDGKPGPPPSTKQFAMERYEFLFTEKIDDKQHDRDKSRYELDNEKISAITTFLKKGIL